MKKNHLSYAFGACLGLFFLCFGCQKELLSEVDLQQNHVERLNAQKADEGEYEEKLEISTHPQLSSQEALSIAGSILHSDKLRANSSLTLDFVLRPDIKTLRSDSSSETYSDPVDTALFIINAADNGGFVLLSGDKRTETLLAFSEEGNLNPKTVEAGNGLRVFLSRLPAYQVSCIEKFNAELDSLALKYSFEEEGDSTSLRMSSRYLRKARAFRKKYRYDYTPWKTIQERSPLISTVWGQRFPYNMKTPIIDGEHALTGCVATATAQLLAYYKYPSKVDGYNINWDFLTPKNFTYSPDEIKVYNYMISNLFLGIGKELKNEWGLKGTGAKPEEVLNFLKKSGYSNPGEKVVYDLDKTMMNLNFDRPVILIGYDTAEYYEKGFWIFTKTHVRYDGGHAWIVDGYKTQECLRDQVERKTGKSVKTETRSRTLLHCNWGWADDEVNGYFLSDVFYATARGKELVVEKGEESKPIWDKDKLFRHHLEQLINIAR